MKKRVLVFILVLILYNCVNVSSVTTTNLIGNAEGTYYYATFSYPSPAYVGDKVTITIYPNVFSLPLSTAPAYKARIEWRYTPPGSYEHESWQEAGTQTHTYTLTSAGQWMFRPGIGWCDWVVWGVCLSYNTAHTTKYISVSPPPPKASFTYSNYDKEGTVDFDASSSSPGQGYITTYTWVFPGLVTVTDNGRTYALQAYQPYSTSHSNIQVLFSYLNTGTSYVSVNLTIWNSYGKTATTTQTVKVVKECHQASCRYTCSQICQNAYYYNSECTTTGTHSSPVAEGNKCKYSWYWGDTAKDCSLHCWCYKVDTNKECTSSVCTNSGWDNSPCTCIPYTCSQMGWECGSGYETHCHKYISCPSCPEGEGCVDHKCVPKCSVQCQGHSFICAAFDYSSYNPFSSGGVCYSNWTNKGKTSDCATTQDCWCYDKETCTPPETCSSPTEGCVCTPDCTNKECGPDGCGGSCGSCSSTDFCNQTTWECQPLKKVDGEPCTSDTECNSGYCSNGYCCNAGECCSSNNDCQDNEYCSLNHNCTPCPENSCGAAAVDSSFACNANEYGVFNHTKHCSLKCFNENESKEACQICNGKAYITAKFHSKVFDEIQKRIGMGMMSPAILTQSVCCPDATYCVFNGKCYPLGTRKDVDMNGKVEICGS